MRANPSSNLSSNRYRTHGLTRFRFAASTPHALSGSAPGAKSCVSFPTLPRNSEGDAGHPRSRYFSSSAIHSGSQLVIPSDPSRHRYE